MKKLWLIVAVALFMAGCNLGGLGGGGNTSSTATKTEPAVEQIKVGDLVVAQWTKNSFWEGKVQSIDGNKAKVAWADGSSPSEVLLSDAFLMPKVNAPVTAKVGDMVLAKQGTGSKCTAPRLPVCLPV